MSATSRNSEKSLGRIENQTQSHWDRSKNAIHSVVHLLPPHPLKIHLYNSVKFVKKNFIGDSRWRETLTRAKLWLPRSENSRRTFREREKNSDAETFFTFASKNASDCVTDVTGVTDAHSMPRLMFSFCFNYAKMPSNRSLIYFVIFIKFNWYIFHCTAT